MKILENIVLKDSVEIGVPPDRVFGFFLRITDDESYQKWHPVDHVAFRWLKGNPWEEGSVARAEEYLHGKLYKLKFCVLKVVPGREIVYGPPSRLLRIYFPGNRFVMEPVENGCVFTAECRLRIGRIATLLAGRKLEKGLSSVRRHMREEGENLKTILEKT